MFQLRKILTSLLRKILKQNFKRLIWIRCNYNVINPGSCRQIYTYHVDQQDEFQRHHVVEDKFFTPHDFISLATRTMSTFSWIFGKSLLKPKRAHIHTKMRQSPWFKLMAHHLIFLLMILDHESHRGNFRSCGLEGQEVCSVTLQWFKVDKGKHVAWRVFPNSLNSDGSVCNR